MIDDITYQFVIHHHKVSGGVRWGEVEWGEVGCGRVGEVFCVVVGPHPRRYSLTTHNIVNILTTERQ